MTTDMQPRRRQAAAPLPGIVRRPATTATALSALCAVLMAIAAAAGAVSSGLYHESDWGAGALRGGDLVTLVVVVPVLVTAVWSARRGSARAHLVWAAMLVYNLYNYTYVVFGTTFNDLFGVHIVILAMSIWALIVLAAGLDVRAVADGFSAWTPVRSVSVLFGAVTLVLAGMWGSAILRQAVTGVLPDDPAGPAGLHMVYATDLTVFVPTLGVAAVLLWRRWPWGYVLATVMATTSTAYLLNLAAAGYFQHRAHVPGVAAFSPLTAGLILAFATASAALVGSLPSDRRRGSTARPAVGAVAPEGRDQGPYPRR